MRMKKFKKLLLLFFTVNTTFAQVDNNVFFDTIANSNDSSKLYLSFSNLNFLKNNEYFHEIATGYTLFGSQLNPRIAWVPNPHVRLESGIFLRKDFGTADFKTLAPTFSLKLNKNGYSFIFGNLESSLNHQLIEPLYNYERVITNRLENGIQFKATKKNIWLDSWMDWERQQYIASPFKEVITAGLSSRVTLFDNEVFKIKVPLQAIVYHHGGQIDTDTTPLLTLANTAAGLSMEADLSKNSWLIKNIRFDNYYAYYRDLSGTKQGLYIKGHGIYSNLLIKTKYHFNLMASYWNGDYFVAARGGYLVQSVSSDYLFAKYSTEDNSQLFILRMMYQRELYPGLLLDVRFEPYKDINNNFVEFSYGVYISYKKDFALKK